MFNHVLSGARLKVYVDGGADFTGDYESHFATRDLFWLRASNGKRILIRTDAVVAVVEL